MKHISKRFIALLITISLLFGSLPLVFASGIEYDEDGGVWDFDKGIYTTPDGDTVSIYNGDSNNGDDSGHVGTNQNPDGSVNTYTGDPPAETTPPQSTPTTVFGYVTTIIGGVNLLGTINGEAIRQLDRGQTYPYLQVPVQDGNYTWYYIQADNDYGYVRNDVVSVNPKSGIEYDEDGGVWDFDRGIYTAPDGNTVTINQMNNSGSAETWPEDAPEASYITLKVGSTGEAVLNLTTELKRQGISAEPRRETTLPT